MPAVYQLSHLAYRDHLRCCGPRCYGVFDVQTDGRREPLRSPSSKLVLPHARAYHRRGWERLVGIGTFQGHVSAPAGQVREVASREQGAKVGISFQPFEHLFSFSFQFCQQTWHCPSLVPGCLPVAAIDASTLWPRARFVRTTSHSAALRSRPDRVMVFDSEFDTRP